MLQRPRYEAKDIERLRGTWLAGIAQEKAEPSGAATRVLPPLLYGEGHPYAMPLSGTGTEASVKALTREDLVAYHRAWVRPDGATLVVVGDTTLKDIVPLLEKHFGNWKVDGAKPAALQIPTVARPAQPRVFLVDQPGSVQANIYAGELMPSTMDPGAIKLDIANTVIGGDFTARLNMNLREDKHWSYGARTSLRDSLGQRPWLAVAPVQIDKAADSIAEMRREITEYADGSKPATPAEVARIQAIKIRSLPGAYETAGSVMGTIGGIVRYQRPDDYVFKRKAEIEGMDAAQVNAAAKAIDPKALTWVVVGDLKQMEAKVRALNLGEVTIVDADGKPVGAGKPAK
jgi:predicted Zn-dependent peptidase